MPEGGRFRRGLWVGLGTAFLCVGAVAVVLPLLPTTPFLLLAAYCYARGSRRLYQWLLEHRYLGVYLRAYERGERVSRGAKAFSLVLLWAAMTATLLLFSLDALVIVLVVAVGAGVSMHIMTIGRASRS